MAALPTVPQNQGHHSICPLRRMASLIVQTAKMGFGISSHHWGSERSSHHRGAQIIGKERSCVIGTSRS
jgi:hypothetical protein